MRPWEEGGLWSSSNLNFVSCVALGTYLTSLSLYPRFLQLG